MFKEERVCYVFASLTHLCVAQVTGYERDKIILFNILLGKFNLYNSIFSFLK